MKGVKKEDEGKVTRRTEFVNKLFMDDCLKRAKDGFIDEPLSGPKAQQVFKHRFGVYLNSQRMFAIRQTVFSQYGLDVEGKPQRVGAPALPGVAQLTPSTSKEPTLQSANRDPADPLFSVAIVSVKDVEQGEFLKAAMATLATRGLIDPDLRVDAVTAHYATVSRFPRD